MTDIERQPSEQAGFSPEAGGSPGQDAVAESWGVGETEEGMDLLAVDGGEKKRRSGALVLVLVVGLAIGSLFSMHTLSKVTGDTVRSGEIEKTVEDFLTALTGNRGSDPQNPGRDPIDTQRAALDVLSHDYSDLQIEVNRNPFSISTDVVSMSGDPSRRREQRRAAMKKAAGELRVQSLLMGARPAAIINGKLVRVGGVIPVPASGGAIAFRVTSIAESGIKIVAEEPELDLRFETTLMLRRRG
ncbi:MAG: hypothetical protein V3T24_13240 [Longimicrobiales bacterium]